MSPGLDPLSPRVKFRLTKYLSLGYCYGMSNLSQAARALGRRSAALRLQKWGRAGFDARMREWGKLGGRPKIAKAEKE